MAPRETTSKHMNREFFSAHNLAIIHICFVENGPQSLVTVDENGHIYFWKYIKEHLTTKQRFEPANRFRIDLSYSKYLKLKENIIFPIKGGSTDAANYMQSNNAPTVNAQNL